MPFSVLFNASEIFISLIHQILGHKWAICCQHQGSMSELWQLLLWHYQLFREIPTKQLRTAVTVNTWEVGQVPNAPLEPALTLIQCMMSRIPTAENYPFSCPTSSRASYCHRTRQAGLQDSFLQSHITLSWVSSNCETKMTIKRSPLTRQKVKLDVTSYHILNAWVTYSWLLLPQH